MLHDVSLTLRRGEIVGMAGMVGAGRTELARVIFGADKASSGNVYVAGRRTAIRKPGDAIKAGIALLTEDRKHQSLVLGMTTASQKIDNADGKSCKPTTSAPTGATVVVKVGATGPIIRAKKMRTPKLLAKIQITKEKRPAKNVQASAVFRRPNLSLM